MVKKKNQKSSQSKKKMDLAAAVEAAEQEVDDELSKPDLNSTKVESVSETRPESTSPDEDATVTGNNEEEGAALMNYNPPEENPTTENTGEQNLLELYILTCFVTNFSIEILFIPAFIWCSCLCISEICYELLYLSPSFYIVKSLFGSTSNVGTRVK